MNILAKDVLEWFVKLMAAPKVIFIEEVKNHKKNIEYVPLAKTIKNIFMIFKLKNSYNFRNHPRYLYNGMYKQ